MLVPLRDVAGLWETPQVSERWHNGSEIVSWFGATVMVTAGVIYTLKLQEERVQPKPRHDATRRRVAAAPLLDKPGWRSRLHHAFRQALT